MGLSGCRLGRITQLRVVRRRHRDPLAPRRHRSRPLTRTEAIGRRKHYEQTRHDRPDPRFGSGPCNNAGYREPVRSGASHEVSSPSAHTGRVALSVVFRRRTSGAAGLRTIPLRRFTPSVPRRLMRPAEDVCPCGFTLLRT